LEGAGAKVTRLANGVRNLCR